MAGTAGSSDSGTPEVVPVVEVSEIRHQRLPRHPRGEVVDQRRRWLGLLSMLADPKDASVDELAIRQALRALADATVRARANDLACFADYCARAGQAPLPATPATIVAYADQLATRGQKVTSITRKLSSVAAAHTLMGLDNPCRVAAVRSALRAIRKERGVGRRQALAVRLGSGDALRPPTSITLHALLAGCGEHPRELRDAALLSVAYDGGLRASEVIAAVVEDVAPQDDGSGILKIPRSKTDQEGEGAFVYLSPDTMQRLQRWLAIAGITTGTIFRRVERRNVGIRHGRPAQPDVELLGGGKFIIVQSPSVPTVKSIRHAVELEPSARLGSAQLSRQGLAKIYRTSARRAADGGHIALFGLELAQSIAAFSTHGFRVGLTQDLFAEQFDVGQIQLAMRWKSPATALSYARQLSVQSNAAAQFLKTRRPAREDGLGTGLTTPQKVADFTERCAYMNDVTLPSKAKPSLNIMPSAM